jgi:endonuclease YncB( thermonuclease family)
MLGWRKRNDGFEWREYVRTTILVRRKHRRDRVGEAGKAAVENMKAAGQRGAAAGAEGAKVVGRGAMNVGQQGAAMGAAGAKAMGRGAYFYGREGARLGAVGARAAGSRLRASIPIAAEYLRRFGAALFAALAYSWAVISTLAGIVYDYAGPLLAPIGRTLRQPSIRVPLLIVGAVSLAGGIIRAVANGFERDTVIALSIGIIVLGALALAHGASAIPARLTSPFAGLGSRVRGALAGRTASPVVQTTFAAGVIALLLAGAWMAWGPSSTGSMTTASLRSDRAARAAPTPGEIEGRGSAVTGDTLRVGATLVRLEGIESPEPDQNCTGADGREWSCGRTARQALSGILRAGRVTCEVSVPIDGTATGDCKVDGRDVAGELVSGGHVFAVPGIFSSYGGLEDEAQANKAGIWVGQASRPSEYRQQKWDEAKRDAPDGCPIKGSVRGSRRYYVVPWARGYERVRVSESRGERWFCSEAEAREAGFRPSEQS